MRYGAGTALILRRASMGPAALVLLDYQRRKFRDGIQPAPRHFSGTLCRGGALNGVGSLGDTAAAKSAGAAVVGKVAGTYTTAQFAAAGAWAGPVGLVVGAAVGLILNKLLTKQYLNVGGANAAEDQAVAAYNQYSQIAGQFAGRQVGSDTMEAIWKGALYSGRFPRNNQQLCFHNGCLKYRGQPNWITGTMHDGAGNPFTFAAAYAAMQRDNVQNAQRVALQSPTAGGRLASGGGFRGFGLIAGAPEAQVLVDQYFLPAQARNNPPWAVPQNQIEHQILYDAADAWLANQVGGGQTTPYIATNSTLPANNAATLTQADPTQGATPPLPTGPQTVTVPGPLGPVTATVQPVQGGPGGGGSNTYDMVPVTNPTSGVTSYQLAPSGSNVAKAAGGVTTAGLSNLPSWTWILVAASVAFALARPAGPIAMPRARKRKSA